MMDKLEHVLAPIAEKLSTNKVLVAIRDGFLVTTPLIIAASVFLLIQNFPINGYAEFMAGIFGESWSVYLGAVAGATFNLLGLLSALGIGYCYARELGTTPISGGVVALVAFLILTPQSHPEFVNADGRAFSGFAYGNMNSSGLFLAMIAAIISVRIFVYVEQKGWVIKLPEGVPPMVMDSFAALIPSFMAILVFFVFRIIFAQTQYGYAHDFIFNVLQTPMMGLGKNPFFPVIYQFLSTLFWFFGINGPAVTNTIFGPISTALTHENLQVFEQFGASGGPNGFPNIYTGSFSNFFGNYGGGGSTLAIVILMVFLAKSERLKQLGKLSIVPGIFGINEMVIFGLPVVLNPVIIIPFILAPVMNISLAYGATAFGLIPRTFGIPIPWTTPIGISGWLATGSFRASLFQFFLLALDMLLYYPFFKVLDKQYLEEEQAPAASEGDALDDISLDDLDLSFD